MRTSIRQNAIARNRRLAGFAALALLALGAISISSLAVSAQTGGTASAAPEAVKTQLASAAIVQPQLRPALADTQEAAPRRQVRVIPLFNIPGDQASILPR